MKRSTKLTSLLEQSYEEILDGLLSKLDEHFFKQPVPEDYEGLGTFLDYLQDHIVAHKTISDIPGVEEQAKKIILKHYQRLSNGERFAFLTYLAEAETYPQQKALLTPSTEEIWQHVYGIWGGNMIVDNYRRENTL